MSRYNYNITIKESKNTKSKENSTIISTRRRTIYPPIRNTENRTSHNSKRNSYIKNNATNNINSKMSLIRNKKIETIEYSSSMKKGGNIKLKNNYKTLEERLDERMNFYRNDIVSAINDAKNSIVEAINNLGTTIKQILGTPKNNNMMLENEINSNQINGNENDFSQIKHKTNNSDNGKDDFEQDVVNMINDKESMSNKEDESKEIKEKEDEKTKEVKSTLSSQENKNKKEDVQNSKSSIKINLNKIEHFDSLHSTKKAREKKNVSKNSDSQSSNSGKNGQSNNISQQAFSIGSKDYIYSESFSKTIKENGPVDLAGGSK